MIKQTGKKKKNYVLLTAGVGGKYVAGTGVVVVLKIGFWVVYSNGILGTG